VDDANKGEGPQDPRTTWGHPILVHQRDIGLVVTESLDRLAPIGVRSIGRLARVTDGLVRLNADPLRRRLTRKIVVRRLELCDVVVVAVQVLLPIERGPRMRRERMYRLDPWGPRRECR